MSKKFVPQTYRDRKMESIKRIWYGPETQTPHVPVADFQLVDAPNSSVKQQFRQEFKKQFPINNNAEALLAALVVYEYYKGCDMHHLHKLAGATVVACGFSVHGAELCPRYVRGEIKVTCRYNGAGAEWDLLVDAKESTRISPWDKWLEKGHALVNAYRSDGAMCPLRVWRDEYEANSIQEKLQGLDKKNAEELAAAAKVLTARAIAKKMVKALSLEQQKHLNSIELNSGRKQSTGE